MLFLLELPLSRHSRRARAPRGDNHLPLLSLPLPCLLRPFVGRFKGGAVVEAEAEGNRLAMQVALAGALVAASPIWCDPVEKANPL